MSEPEQTAAPATEAPLTTEQIAAVAAEVFGADAVAPVTEPAKEPEAAKPAEPKPDPVADKVAARIAIAKRAEQRAAQSRAEIAAAKAEVDAQRAELAEQVKVVEGLKAAKLSPSKALELLGMSPKEFLESLATEHEPAAVAARAVKGTTDEVAALKAEVAAMRKAAQEREFAIQKHAADADYNAATQGFLEQVAANHVKYPALVAEFSDAEIAKAAQAAIDEVVGRSQDGRPITRNQAFIRDHGRPPTDDELAEFLEYRAAERQKTRSAWHQRIGLGAPPSEGKPSGDLQVAQPATGPSPRTLTSRTASEKATAAKPWSQEQADEESLRILSAALKAG